MSHHSGAEVKLWAFLYQLFLLYCHSVRHGMAAVLRHHFKIISGWTARQLYTYSQEDDSQADSVTLATVGMDFWLCCMSLSSSTTCLFLPVQCLFQTSAPHTGSCCYWVMLSWQFGPFYKVKSQINPHPPPRTYTHTHCVVCLAVRTNHLCLLTQVNAAVVRRTIQPIRRVTGGWAGQSEAMLGQCRLAAVTLRSLLLLMLLWRHAAFIEIPQDRKSTNWMKTLRQMLEKYKTTTTKHDLLLSTIRERPEPIWYSIALVVSSLPFCVEMESVTGLWLVKWIYLLGIEIKCSMCATVLQLQCTSCQNPLTNTHTYTCMCCRLMQCDTRPLALMDTNELNG